MIGFEQILGGFKSTAVFVMVLSILIIVHEWGHFITAKKLGIKVEKFSLGFGKKLVSFMHNGTEFLICLIPLGGYVKMAGDERGECTGDPQEFYSQSPGRRALVVFNGPLVNFVMAYLCLVCVFALGYPGLSTRINELKKDGPAQLAGLEVGDKILSVNDKQLYGWMHYERLLEGEEADPIKLTILRSGEEITRTIKPEVVDRTNLLGQEIKARDIGVVFHTNIIGGLSEGFPAKEAGLQVGDEIILIDGHKITNWSELESNISRSTGEAIRITYKREGKTLVKNVIPKVVEVEDESGEMINKRRIGIGPAQEFDSFKFDIGSSFLYAFDELSFITALTYKAIYKMVTLSMSAKESVTGPVGIFVIVKSAAELGISHLLFILGVISASLAIFNLLPIIPLDGGHLFLLTIEKLRGSPLPEKIDEFIAKVGFSLIILLAIFVFYNDFARFGIFDKFFKLFS